VFRAFLQQVARVAFAVLSDMHIIGRENIPEGGPLLLVANHFSFIDPVAMVRVAPWPIEFIGGFRRPNAPAWTTMIPGLWGFLPVFRGTGSRFALRAGHRSCGRRDPVRPFWPLERVPGCSPWGLMA
jgi:1-acyl-sn-glycerol-3-phosphate acyltransferase